MKNVSDSGASEEDKYKELHEVISMLGAAEGEENFDFDPDN